MTCRTIIRGRIGKMENKTLQNGTAVSRLSVASNRSYKDDAGQWQKKTTWHDVTVYGKQAEKIHRHFSVGDELYIEGENDLQSWTGKDGNKRFRYYVNAKSVDKIWQPPKDSDAQPLSNVEQKDDFEDDSLPF